VGVFGGAEGEEVRRRWLVVIGIFGQWGLSWGYWITLMITEIGLILQQELLSNAFIQKYS
jgi:hypothetical protein